jgi:hypothetical protein
MGGYPLLGFPLDFVYYQAKIDSFPLRRNGQQLAIQSGIDLNAFWYLAQKHGTHL